MKVIMSCDDNPGYSDYWPIVRWMWKYLGYEPHLFHVSHDSIYKDDPLVHPIQPSQHNIVSQSQIARIYGCMQFPEDVCVTSDIDALLLQKDYLRRKWEQHNPDGEFMLVYSHGAYKLNPHQVNMQFIGGTGSKWTEVMGCGKAVAWPDFMDKFRTEEYGWFSDEMTLSQKMYYGPSVRTIYLPRPRAKGFLPGCGPTWMFSDRIYRHCKFRCDREKLKNGYYVDVCTGMLHDWKDQIRDIWNAVYDTPLPITE